jgi:hypothetical protein
VSDAVCGCVAVAASTSSTHVRRDLRTWQHSGPAVRFGLASDSGVWQEKLLGAALAIDV